MADHRGRRFPLTLWLGLALILACEALLAVDVIRRDGIIIPSQSDLPATSGFIGRTARLVAVNMTVLCWVGYLLVCDGLLTALSRRRGDPGINCVRGRPHRFVVAWLTSVPIWCYFDWVNFHFMDAWRYHGLPPQYVQRVAGYFVAFAAISPGMFMAAQLFQHLGFKRLRTTPVRITRPVQVVVCLLGAILALYPFYVRDPIGNLTLWISLMFLLDPINHWLAAPSIIGDWRAGRFGRTLALMAAGAVCGLLWEFWNYWALTKWTYHLPFVGALEHYKIFEMPWIGFQGFLPFAIECWVILNTVLALARRVRLRVAEPLPDHDAII